MTRHVVRVGVALAVGLFAPAAGLGDAPLGIAHVAAQTPGDVALTVTNRENTTRNAEPVTSGVPFAQGRVRDAGQLRLLRDGTEVPAQFLITARWPDGSVRWVLADFQADLPSAGQRSFTLQTGTGPQPVNGIAVRDEPDTLTIDTQARTFVFAKSELQVRGHRFEVRAGDGTYRATPRTWVVEEQGPMKVVVRVDGDWRDGSRPLVNAFTRFRARLIFFRGRDEIRTQVVFRNGNSFGWDTSGEGDPRQDDIALTGASFGSATLLSDGGPYRFGSGVEKTWDVEVPYDGGPRVRTTRYDRDGNLLGADAAPRPLAAATPAYYASTRAWGTIGLPVTGAAEGRQEDFDRYERLQRAKVDRTALEDPPGVRGMALWEHLSADLGSWNDYGDLRWDGNGCGTLSGNHYDWGYGLYLQFLRTGTLAFADAARVLLRHEIDFDIYHTDRDGTAFNYQKNWEDRPSHDTPDNCFGPGRPSHTWSQGYVLQWLLTGDRRGKDAFDEIQEGVRQYVYESFNGEGVIDTPEIRIQGWLLENLVARWRIEPNAVLTTSQFGAKSLPRAMQDVLRTVFAREEAAGRAGFVISDEENGAMTQPLLHLYILEPLIEAHGEVFIGRDADYASALLDLVRRMTGWLRANTYGGDADGGGRYRPRQIPYWIDTKSGKGTDGQLPYLLMAANSAAYVYGATGDESFRDYARAAFRDYVRYVGSIPPDTYGDPASRTPASYNSAIFTGTESKINGWMTRYGQHVLASESPPAAGGPGALRRGAHVPRP